MMFFVCFVAKHLDLCAVSDAYEVRGGALI